jgi:hypothetical protein
MLPLIRPPKVGRSLIILCVAVLISALGSALVAADSAAAGVMLSRIYHPHHTMVYDAEITTRVVVHSDTAALNSLIADIPRVITIRLRNTLTVEKVFRNGSADIRDRLDAFHLLTQGDGPAGEGRGTQQYANADLDRQVAGQVLTVSYDRSGDLLGFTGAQPMLQNLTSPTRDLVRLVLRALLSQFEGSGLYSGHPLRVADTWKSKTVTLFNAVLPASFQIERTFEYKGDTRYHGVKAATVDFHFADSLTPEADGRPSGSLLSLLNARGVSLIFIMTGGGSGSALVAINNGGILHKDATFQENLHASLKGVPGQATPASGPATVDVSTQNSIEITAE